LIEAYAVRRYAVGVGAAATGGLVCEKELFVLVAKRQNESKHFVAREDRHAMNVDERIAEFDAENAVPEVLCRPLEAGDWT
jgi:hypothetical protein